MSTECVQTSRILKILTSIWTEKPSKRVPRAEPKMALFLVQNWSKKREFLDQCLSSVLGSSGLRFGPQNWVRKSKKWDRKNGTCFWKVWETPWNRLGSLLGRLGALLGSLMFQKTSKKHINTHLFEITSFRYRSSLGPLLTALLVPFGPFWAPKWPLNSIRSGSKKLRFFDQFWTKNGAIFGPILGTLFCGFSG